MNLDPYAHGAPSRTDFCNHDPWLAVTAIITMEDEGEATKYTARVLHSGVT